MADNDERNKLTTDYFRYKEAEAIYNAKHPRPKTRKIEDPRREHRGTKRRHALAMGEAFEAWRKTPQGASSKAVLKEFSVTNGALQNDILFDVLGCCGCRDLSTGVVTHVWFAWFVLRCSVYFVFFMFRTFPIVIFLVLLTWNILSFDLSGWVETAGFGRSGG